MKPPSTVKVGPFGYTVAVGGRAWDLARLQEPSEPGLIGHCDNQALVISMAPDIADGAAREVLLHEVMHACCNLAGQPLSEMGTDVEENAVRVMSPGLLGVLRDNPDLVAWLTADG